MFIGGITTKKANFFSLAMIIQISTKMVEEDFGKPAETAFSFAPSLSIEGVHLLQ